jgi:16S rRNA (uracil1498-N3)-methyltransferase
MKQSLKTFLPKLNPLKKLTDFVNMESKNELFIAHCNDSKKNLLYKSIKPNSLNTILIGPEGDFTKKEIADL